MKFKGKKVERLFATQCGEYISNMCMGADVQEMS